MRRTGPARLAEYYAQAADDYDNRHVLPGDVHFVALEYMLGLFATFRIRSVLDVGCGTGRAVRFIKSRRPDLRVVGVEPTDALRQKAIESGVGEYVDGRGEALPFGADDFDAVIATGIMHHVADATLVVREMMRVAQVAVMISDTNRFGSGPKFARAIKVGGFMMGLGRPLTLATTRGRGYVELSGDGLHYPYSVYDQLQILGPWADRTFLIPTSGGAPGNWLGPLMCNNHALLVAAKEPTDDVSWAAL